MIALGQIHASGAQSFPLAEREWARYYLPMRLRQRSALRRRRIVAHRTENFAGADAWDLEFYQRQTPEARPSALVAIREDIRRVKGRDRALAWES
jgi:hypothetical protein